MDDLLINDGVNEEILIDFDPDSFKEDWQKNSAWSIGFTVPRTVRNAITYDMIQGDKIIIYEGQQFIIKSLNPNATGPVTYKEVTAPHIYFTCQDHRQYDQQSKIWSIDEAMHWAFDNNVLGFDFEIIGSFPTVQIDNFGDNDALSMLSDILNKFGAILEADNKHLILYSAAEWGSISEKVIRYQHNTDGVQCTVDTSNLKTVIRGYGKQNDDGSYVFDPVTYTSPNITKYGERHAAPIRDDRFLYADSMLTYLQTQLQDEPVVSLSAPLKTKEDISRGEHRLLIYEPLNLDTDVQIIAYSKYPRSNKPPEVTFSNSTKNMVDVMSSFANVGTTVGKVIDDNGQVRTEALGTTVADAVQKINSVVTSDDLLDLTKSTGKIQESQARIGPGTTFAAGYDPIQQDGIPLATDAIDGLLSKEYHQIVASLPEVGIVGPGGQVTYKVLVSDVVFGGLMSPEDVKKVHSLLANEDGSVAEATETDDGLLGFIDKQNLNKLSLWFSGSGFNPKVEDPKNSGTYVNLSDVLSNFETRIATLEGGTP
ncbi:phage tail protein [Sporolactobacillus kofuensis]|uniref:Phage tail protein n=1 Tax=Sporolactobacillus kofuensis TaxID=269672 RepID=A0ABW1WBQ8_9BACL|nr:phage tail protein [Sporolactobacillus kofuensis]MCO7175563.1 phage tail protein [Sporolactobacillus kofuensis]